MKHAPVLVKLDGQHFSLPNGGEVKHVLHVKHLHQLSWMIWESDAEQISQSPVWADHQISLLLRKLHKVHLSHLLRPILMFSGCRGDLVRYLIHFCGLIWIA